MTVFIERKDHLNMLLVHIKKHLLSKLWVSEKSLNRDKNTTFINENSASKILGQTFGCLVVENMHNVTANTLLIAIGTIRFGGIIIFLCEKEPTPFNKNIIDQLLKLNNTIVFDSLGKPIIPEFNFTKKIEFDAKDMLNKKANDICKFILYKNKKLKVVCLTGPRGRGKSTCLSICILNLLKEGFSRILIVSDKKDHFLTLKTKIESQLIKENKKLESDAYKIVFSTDFTLNSAYDLVLVEEAANINPDILIRICSQRNIILTSTCTGYEGTGQMFKLDFLNKIKRNKEHDFLEQELLKPIRYKENDYVEKWLNDVCCLNLSKDIDINGVVLHKNVNFDEILIEKIEKNKITTSDLYIIVNLFQKTHYKNNPNDLQLLINSSEHEIYVLKYKNILIGAVQIAIEKKIQNTSGSQEGNLVSWMFFNKYKKDYLLKTKGLRIVRICIHENYQCMGIGSFFIKFLEKNVSFDWIGVSFGMSYSLLNFWFKNNFFILAVNQHKSKSTGKNNVLCIKHKIENDEFLKYFKLTTENIMGNLKGAFDYLDSETICLISKRFIDLCANKTEPYVYLEEKTLLNDFLCDKLVVEDVNHLFNNALIFVLSRTNSITWLCKAIMCEYVFKQESFKNICKKYKNLSDSDILVFTKNFVKEYLRLKYVI